VSRNWEHCDVETEQPRMQDALAEERPAERSE
jgi:hypothetical protein